MHEYDCCSAVKKQHCNGQSHDQVSKNSLRRANQYYAEIHYFVRFCRNVTYGCFVGLGPESGLERSGAFGKDADHEEPGLERSGA